MSKQSEISIANLLQDKKLLKEAGIKSNQDQQAIVKQAEFITEIKNEYKDFCWGKGANHQNCEEYLLNTIRQAIKFGQQEILDYIACEEGWEESKNHYIKHFNLK